MARTPQKHHRILGHHVRMHIVSTWVITVTLTLISWLGSYLPSFFFINLIFFPLLNLVRRYFQTHKYLLSIPSSTNSSLHWWSLPKTVIMAMVAKWRFSNYTITSTFTSWHSVLRKSFPFFPICQLTFIFKSYITVGSWIVVLFWGLIIFYYHNFFSCSKLSTVWPVGIKYTVFIPKDPNTSTSIASLKMWCLPLSCLKSFI